MNNLSTPITYLPQGYTGHLLSTLPGSYYTLCPVSKVGWMLKFRWLVIIVLENEGWF
jgi:hypothetical protein